MKLVGLTGGIACGKSVASNYLKHIGFPVIDCDAIAFEVVKKVFTVV
jgi:dephospho-CoA kinase